VTFLILRKRLSLYNKKTMEWKEIADENRSNSITVINSQVHSPGFIRKTEKSSKEIVESSILEYNYLFYRSTIKK